jgi:SNF2 family DNA or RNA helicase
MEFQKVNKLKKTAAVLRLITQLKLICNHPSLVLKEKVTISDVLKTLDEAEDDDSDYDEEEEEDTEIKPDETIDTKEIIASEIENVDETAIMEMDEEDVGEVPETEEIVEKEVIIENKRDLWKYILRSEKLTRTIDMIEEILNSDQKCLIFTQYVKMGKILMQIIESIFDTKVLFLHGQIPGQYREKYVELFQDPESDYKIFILTLKVGGTGLNLTEASYVIHFDRWWNPAVENQATDRAYRIGQTKPVQVYKFMAEGTIEEKINDLIEEKKELTESIVGTRSEKWITDLSDSELKQLFQYGGLQL